MNIEEILTKVSDGTLSVDEAEKLLKKSEPEIQNLTVQKEEIPEKPELSTIPTEEVYEVDVYLNGSINIVSSAKFYITDEDDSIETSVENNKMMIRQKKVSKRNHKWQSSHDVELTLGIPDQFVVNVSGNIDACCSNSAATLNIDSNNGDIEFRNCTGAINSETNCGTISLRNCSCDAKVKIGSGDCDIRGHSGKITVKGMCGDLYVKESSGTISYKTLSGCSEISSFRGQLNLDSKSGDFELQNVSGDLSAKTASGDISVEVLKDTSPTSMNIHATSGDISLELPENPGASIHTRSISGDVCTEGNIKPTQKDRKTAQWVVGENGPSNYVLATVSGDIEITART